MDPNNDRKGLFDRFKKKKDEETNLYEDQGVLETLEEEFTEELLTDPADCREDQQTEDPADITETEEQADESGTKTGKKSFPFFKKKKSGEDTEEGSAEEGPAEEKPAKEKKPLDKAQKKKIAGIIIGVLVVAAVVTAVSMLFGGSDSDRKVYVESVRVITGYGTSNGMNNRYTGVVEPQDSEKVKLQSGMSVEKCYVKEGQTVKKGDKLFTYNTTEIRLNKEKKELEIKSLENESKQLAKDIKTYEASMAKASSSEKIELQTEKLTAQTTIKKNEYTIKADQAEIKTLEASLKDATVKANMGGVIKSINKSLGAGDQGSDNSDYDSMNRNYDYGNNDANSDEDAYIVIMAVGSYRIKGRISETNASSVSEGDPVIIRSRVTPETWAGTIEKLLTDQQVKDDGSSDIDDDMYGNTPSESASSYNFYVKLDADEGLMMGQHVLIEPDDGQDKKKEGLWLPAAYVMVDGDEYYVWATDIRNRISLKKIQVGEYDEALEEYEILGGLKIDDYIACNESGLEEGMRITKNEAEQSTGQDVEPGAAEDDDDDFDDDEDGDYDDFDEDMEEDLEDDYEMDLDDEGPGLSDDEIIGDDYEEDLIQR